MAVSTTLVPNTINQIHSPMIAGLAGAGAPSVLINEELLEGVHEWRGLQEVLKARI